jgi:hypothetical protein
MRLHLKDDASLSTRLFPHGGQDWLDDKAERDRDKGGCPDNLWLINEKLYDLNNWIDKHPGGNQWLEFTRGQDCTAAFEVHHLNMVKVQTTLKQFYVRDVDSKYLGATQPYSWSDDGFYRTLRKEAWEVLKNHGGNRATNFMIFLNFVVLVLFFAAFTITYETGSYLYAFLTAYTIYLLMGVGHNFFHQQNSWWRYCFDFTVFTHTDW